MVISGARWMDSDNRPNHENRTAVQVMSRGGRRAGEKQFGWLSRPSDGSRLQGDKIDMTNDPITTLLLLGISIGMHALPSNVDLQNFSVAVRTSGRRGLLYAIVRVCEVTGA